MSSTIEIWKDIPEYEGLYQISTLGRVKSLGYIGCNQTGKSWSHNRELIMKPEIINDGYYRIGLSKNGKRRHYLVHRLVAKAFIPNPNNLYCINHKDENKANNSVSNLEWCTQSYNNSYGNRRLKVKTKIAKKVRCIETDIVYDSIGDAYKAFNKKYQGSISMCCNNKAITALGYHWEFVGSDLNG